MKKPSPSTTPKPEPKPKPKPKPKPEPRATAPAPTARRFAWAPIDGASGYLVKFFRGSTLVFAHETSHTVLEVPARWRHGGLERSFRPGEYRWYVWPVIDGKRAALAAVRTTVSIPRS